MSITILILAGSILLGIGLRRLISIGKIRKIQKDFQKKQEEVKATLETRRENHIVSLENEIKQSRQSFDREIRNMQQDLRQVEQRIKDKEKILEQKKQRLLLLQEEKAKVDQHFQEGKNQVEQMKDAFENVLEKMKSELEKQSGQTQEALKQEYLKKFEEEIRGENENYVKLLLHKKREGGSKEAKRILEIVVQRMTLSHTAEGATTMVSLPSDEMKGRVIGKEGRNIQALEMVTGAEYILDQSSNVVTIQCADPIRREVARRSLERLIQDGRINPSRIEEVAKNAKDEIEDMIQEVGEETIFDLNVKEVHPDLIKLIGKLKFRTSQGQNVLHHLKECAYLMNLIASEVGLDATLAKRVGLLHDIGKSIEKEVEGEPVAIGSEIAKRYGEDPVLVNAIESELDQQKAESPIAILTSAVHYLSGSRPGARSEKMQNYMSRLDKIERVASRVKGVERSYALQGGREVRVFVNPEKVNDQQAKELAKEVIRILKDKLEYSGEIKVIVIRETRSVETTK